jgi:hypothetical protein
MEFVNRTVQAASLGALQGFPEAHGYAGLKANLNGLVSNGSPRVPPTRTWNLDEQDAAFERISLSPDVLIAEPITQRNKLNRHAS